MSNSEAEKARVERLLLREGEGSETSGPGAEAETAAGRREGLLPYDASVRAAELGLDTLVWVLTALPYGGVGATGWGLLSPPFSLTKMSVGEASW